ncbi:spore germination protein [Paenibacillus sacheonensis]|uniref:Spore germination protein n=1 Tax=Paenibacillus sacheonensis TaxID=742054 RepID=A0A7X4YN58_9BACL|nr:spore germination protein [Paenibacillus sacheonensis]MBM7564885.1 spore germination protein KA [Paenibacillus sacheonensis]NBC69433.1 spore germination protein [Paenibacillus sacheonensis]
MNQPGTDSLPDQLDVCIKQFSSAFDHCFDFVIRRFALPPGKEAALLYLEGIVDTTMLVRYVVEPLATASEPFHSMADVHHRMAVPNMERFHAFQDAAMGMSAGKAVLLLDGESEALAFEFCSWEKRNIEEPTSETVVRGPREGFVENVATNTSLLRRKLRHPDLKMERMTIGRYSQTEVVISYIQGIIEPHLVEEMQTRLQRIDVDGILESAYIEELIEDNPYSPFPQVGSTERPDTVAAALLEGRIAVFVGGTPFVLLAPNTFAMFMQASEDYYQRYYIASAVRMLRYLFTLIALLAPSIYVAVLSYHQEMIPSKLILSMSQSRESIPFPAFVEALLMEITFEALREAGVRLPKQVGAAVSIVGALVIGQAAIAAGLVSAPMVMVVAITGIASFLIPHYPAGISIRLLRFPIICLAGLLGLLGVMLSIILIIVHLTGLRSFGAPYLMPLAPFRLEGFKDLFVRAPRWLLTERPRLTGQRNARRQGTPQKPGPRNKGGLP